MQEVLTWSLMESDMGFKLLFKFRSGLNEELGTYM